MKPDEMSHTGVDQILERINSLEERIALLESNKAEARHLQPANEYDAEEEDSVFSDLNISISAPFESNLGEYGLAWLGNIVLFFAIVFLWQYFNDAGKPVLSMLVGVISVAGVFTLAHYFRKHFSFLSFMFNLFAFVILYYVVLRLHFYTEKPLLANQHFSAILLLSVVGVQLYFAVKKQSQVLAGLAFAMALTTAYVYNQTLAFFLISLSTSALAVLSFWRFNWWKVLVFIIIAGFIVNLAWLLGKTPVSVAKIPPDLGFRFAFLFFSVTAAVYSLVVFRKQEVSFPGNIVLTTLMLAGVTYSMLLFTLVVNFFPTTFVPLFMSISIYCIVYSVILKFYSPWKYAPALFALFGFVAISITVYDVYRFPDSFLLLICQSVLVLVLALWYRSQIITLMNTFLLLILITLYYSISGKLQMVNFAIPLVAFLSARTINWQKERLNIKTDFIRNIYLFTLFFSLLYATYNGLQGRYVTVSWLFIAGIYFGLSIFIKSIKYRWMAMGNLLIAAFYLFLVDLAKIDLIFRILIFLAFAITSIVISTYYVKKIKNRDNGESVV